MQRNSSRNKAALAHRLTDPYQERYRMPRLFTGIEIPPRSASPSPAFAAACPGRAGSIPRTTTSPCASSATSTTGWRRRHLVFGDTRQRPLARHHHRRARQLRRGKPRASFARTSGNGEMNELQAEQERLLRQVGLQPETRKPRAPYDAGAPANTSPIDVADYITIPMAISRS